MPKLTEDEKESLEEEMVWCKEVLTGIVAKINKLTNERDVYTCEYREWKQRFELADRKYAIATKLTIYGKEERKKEGVVKSLENILKDKDKLKRFIKLLENEGGNL